ncbi:hypothetical protein ASE51_10545 [Bacillus sp. Root147]|nr:hypothetical protein ASE51_10545 [Bacillus sp. Root147]
MTGRDIFGNKISEEQRKASLLQALGIAGAGALSTKVAGKMGQSLATKGTEKLNNMRLRNCWSWGAFYEGSGENGTKPCDQRNRKAQQHAQHASHKHRCQRHKTSLPKRQKRTGLLDSVAT